MNVNGDKTQKILIRRKIKYESENTKIPKDKI